MNKEGKPLVKVGSYAQEAFRAAIFSWITAPKFLVKALYEDIIYFFIRSEVQTGIDNGGKILSEPSKASPVLPEPPGQD
jgi:hypothetical protein